MTNGYFNSKSGSIFEAAHNVLSNVNEALVGGSSDPDITVWTKKGEHNYDNFLAANEDRIGKPMIDGGLFQIKDRVVNKDAEQVNGQPVEGMIYCGSGCVTYTKGGTKRFVKLPSQLINTSDGTVPWSKYASYDSEGVLIEVDSGSFKDIAKAVAIAAAANF